MYIVRLFNRYDVEVGQSNPHTFEEIGKVFQLYILNDLIEDGIYYTIEKVK